MPPSSFSMRQSVRQPGLAVTRRYSLSGVRRNEWFDMVTETVSRSTATGSATRHSDSGNGNTDRYATQ